MGSISVSTSTALSIRSGAEGVSKVLPNLQVGLNFAHFCNSSMSLLCFDVCSGK